MTTVSDAGLDRANVVASVVAAVLGVLNRGSVEVDERTRLLDELGLDSTNVLELLMNLEDELGMAFDADSLEQRHFETVGTLADYVIEESGA